MPTFPLRQYSQIYLLNDKDDTTGSGSWPVLVDQATILQLIIHINTRLYINDVY